jgi:uncharacterized membrane protein
MPKLSARGLKWLKGFHLIAVSCWIGGGFALVLLYFLKNGVTDGGVLYGINQSTHHVDWVVVIIPGAFGCLTTGLLFSVCSNWGFFRHTWIVFKWIITILAILFGSYFLGPWETAMVEISGKLGIASLRSPEYLYNERMHVIFAAVQLLALFTMVFVSIFKPWKSTKAKNRTI